MAKMTAEERKQFFAQKLNEQRHLLRASITAMGVGDLTQALHVATIIRTLVHETEASKPLLKHLHANYLELPILDRIMEPPKDLGGGVKSITFTCPVSATISDKGIVSLVPDVPGPEYVQSTLGVWWDRNPCMVLPALGPFSRRELVLGLANKEGGAHVDADIPERYQLVLDSQFVRFKINEIDVGPLNISRLVAGRAGVELLDCLDKNFPV
jgi:hypothetical protein